MFLNSKEIAKNNLNKYSISNHVQRPYKKVTSDFLTPFTLKKSHIQ